MQCSSASWSELTITWVQHLIIIHVFGADGIMKEFLLWCKISLSTGADVQIGVAGVILGGQNGQSKVRESVKRQPGDS